MDCTFINFDEASFRLVPFLRRIWALKGSKPKGLFWWCNKKAHIFGALVDGKELFYDWYERLNSITFIDFVKRFVATLDKQRKYVFILDNAPAHRAKRTKEFFATLGENTFIEFLPPYSPQLNCIETCWKIIRHAVTNSNLFKSIIDLKGGVEQFLNCHIFSLVPTNYLTR